MSPGVRAREKRKIRPVQVLDLAVQGNVPPRQVLEQLRRQDRWDIQPPTAQESRELARVTPFAAAEIFHAFDAERGVVTVDVTSQLFDQEDVDRLRGMAGEEKEAGRDDRARYLHSVATRLEGALHPEVTNAV